MKSNTLTDEAILNALGDRLSRYRLARNLTQAHLAREAGVSKRTVERLEAGESTQLSNFIRILRALDLAPKFDQLIPEPRTSPMAQLRQTDRQRQRASSHGDEQKAKKEKWTWGDEP